MALYNVHVFFLPRQQGLLIPALSLHLHTQKGSKQASSTTGGTSIPQQLPKEIAVNCNRVTKL